MLLTGQRTTTTESQTIGLATVQLTGEVFVARKLGECDAISNWSLNLDQYLH
jgi:hypothetical protein